MADNTETITSVMVTVRDSRTSRYGDSNDELTPYLVVLSGTDRGKRFQLDQQVNIFGRGAEADIVIHDSKVSRRHASFTILPGQILLEDLQSTNGIFVDGERVSRTTVGLLSRIRIGNCLLKIDYKSPNELEFEQALYNAATTDALTGVFNRTAFTEQALQQASFCRRNGMQLTLGMCDADHFKSINDQYGHPAGDHVLKELARIAQGEIRQEDLLARYGGEEFILLLPRTGADAATECFERIRAAVEDHVFRYDEQRISATVSIGLCSRQGSDIRSLEEMIEEADQALYRAKRSGRNRVALR